MNLFEDQDEDYKVIKKDLEPWIRKGVIPEEKLVFLNELVKSLYHNDNTVYPDKKDVFRAFKATNPKRLKVVIIGQDPYHDGNATGLAFDCKNEISPSLSVIASTIANTYVQREKIEIKNPDNVSFEITLENWAEQGVLLLNTKLTVEKGQPNSHSGMGWEQFAYEVIKGINERYTDIVFLLWGSFAISFKDFVDTQKHLVITSEHPAFAARHNMYWNTNCFYGANDYLIKKGKKPIKWIENFRENESGTETEKVETSNGPD